MTEEAMESQVNWCDSCARSSDCEVLREAMTILGRHESLSRSEENRELFSQLQQKLSDLGYSFPLSHKFCHLRDDEKRVHDLVFECIRLHARFSRKSSRDSLEFAHRKLSLPGGIPHDL